VSKYNAIYGSFAFLPLLLIWLQLVWIITLAGAVLCYSSQNIFQFSFNGNINNISLDYKRKVAIVIMTIIVKRFEQQSPPLTLPDFAALYHMPSRLVTELISEMSEAGLVSIVYSETDKDQHAYQPAMDINKISVGLVLDRLNKLGTTEFIPNFKTEFAPVIKVVADAVKDIIDKESEILLMNLPVNIDGTPTKIK
jgi:membrane protein